MAPYVFEVFGFKVGSYGLMMACGFLFTGWLLSRELRRLGYLAEYAWEVVLAAAVFGVLGARALAIIEDPGDPGASLWELLFSRGGLTWQGGFAPGAAGVLLVLRWRKIPLGMIADVCAPLLALGYAFGRGGCHLSGDGCYGIHTDLPWGYDYANGIVTPADLGLLAPVHPTPIYEIIYSVAGFAILWFWLRKKPLPRGFRIALYLVFAAVSRFLIEFIRVNDRYAGLSLAQWLSVAMFVGGVVWLVLIRNRPPADDHAPPGGGGTLAPSAPDDEAAGA